MPNWCYNQLLITAPTKERLQEVLDFIKPKKDPETGEVSAADDSNEDDIICFNSILPMPEILAKTSCGATTIDGVTLNVWVDETVKDPETGKDMRVCRALTPEEDAEVKATGFTDWFDWRVATWGTKWNAGEQSMHYTYDELSTEITFNTAWGPPEGIIEALREKFEDCDIVLNFRLEYYSEYPHSL